MPFASYHVPMVSAVHFFALAADEQDLLDGLGEPRAVRLFRWGPTRDGDDLFLERGEVVGHARLGILNVALGRIEVIRPGGAAFTKAAKAATFNRLNWERMRPGEGEGLVDWNTTPALLWDRGRCAGSTLTPSNLGSQADSMDAISEEYRKWANRSMSWVRRAGTRVWGDTRESDHNVSLPFVNAVYALPAALVFFRRGGSGRVRVDDP